MEKVLSQKEEEKNFSLFIEIQMTYILYSFQVIQHLGILQHAHHSKRSYRLSPYKVPAIQGIDYIPCTVPYIPVPYTPVTYFITGSL